MQKTEKYNNIFWFITGFFFISSFCLASGKSAYVVFDDVCDQNTKNYVSCIYQVGKDNSIKFLKSYKYYSSSIMGDDKPIISYSGKQYAYIKDNNIWIANSMKEQGKQITFHGFEGDEHTCYVGILLTSWSYDNSKLLYYSHDIGCNEDLEDFEEEKSVRKFYRGFSAYDLNSNKTINITGDYEDYAGWNYRDEIIFENINEVVAVSLDGKARTVFSHEGIENAVVSNNGKKMIVSIRDDFLWFKMIKLLEIDLMSLDQKLLSGRDSWESKYRSPKYSKNNEHYSWVNGYNELVVNNETIFKNNFINEHYWLDDSRIILSSDKDLYIIDTADGKILNKFGHANE